MRYPQGHGRSHVSDNARPLEVCWGIWWDRQWLCFCPGFSQCVKDTNTWGDSTAPPSCPCSGCSCSGCVLWDESASSPLMALRLFRATCWPRLAQSRQPQPLLPLLLLNPEWKQQGTWGKSEHRRSRWSTPGPWGPPCA